SWSASPLCVRRDTLANSSATGMSEALQILRLGQVVEAAQAEQLQEAWRRHVARFFCFLVSVQGDQPIADQLTQDCSRVGSAQAVELLACRWLPVRYQGEHVHRRLRKSGLSCSTEQPVAQAGVTRLEGQHPAPLLKLQLIGPALHAIGAGQSVQ